MPYYTKYLWILLRQKWKRNFMSETGLPWCHMVTRKIYYGLGVLQLSRAKNLQLFMQMIEILPISAYKLELSEQNIVCNRCRTYILIPSRTAGLPFLHTIGSTVLRPLKTSAAALFSLSSRACLRQRSHCYEFPPNWSVASPRFIGCRSASMVLSQDCLGWPILRLQLSGGPAMQVWRARWWSCPGSAV